MANEEHLRILRQGVKVRNQWRKENPEVSPWLEGAYLPRADLRSTDVRQADLAVRNDIKSGDVVYLDRVDRARLVPVGPIHARPGKRIGVNLNGVNLRGADLRGADLSMADFASADLSFANLSEAKLGAANLYAARVIRADLRAAYLRGRTLGRPT